MFLKQDLSLYSSKWPRTHSVAQAGLKFMATLTWLDQTDLFSKESAPEPSASLEQVSGVVARQELLRAGLGHKISIKY